MMEYISFPILITLTLLSIAIIGISYCVTLYFNQQTRQSFIKFEADMSHTKERIDQLSEQLQHSEDVISTIQTGIQSGDSISIINAQDQRYDFVIKKIDTKTKINDTTKKSGY